MYPNKLRYANTSVPFSSFIIFLVYCGLFFGFFFTVPSVSAGESYFEDNLDKPVWLIMLEGKKSFGEGNYGKALTLFRTVVEKQSNRADAHLWIGYIFEAEGEFEIAKRKFEQSLEEGMMFVPSQERITAEYALARISRKLGKNKSYTERLKKIIEKESSDDITEALINAIIKNMKTKGPDKVLELYRVREKPVQRAYTLLAEEALHEEKFSEALEYYSLFFSISMTSAVESMEQMRPEYRFIKTKIPLKGEGFYVENTSRFLEDVEKEERIIEYFNSIRFYRNLFFFAAALHGAGYPDAARSMWLIVVDHRESGVWSNLSREMATNPDLASLSALLER